MNDDGGDAARCLLEEFLDDPDADWAVLDGLPMPPPENRFRGGDEEVGVPLPMPLPANRLRGGDEEVDDGPLAEKRLGVDAQEGGELLDPKRLGVDDPERPGVDEQKAVLQPPAMDPLPPLPTPLPENRFRGGDKEVGGPLAVKRFGVDELEVEAFPSVGASAAEPPVSEELVQRLDPPVSGVMDSPLVLLFAFFSWKWRKKLVQLMAVFGCEGGLAKEMAGLLVDAQESGNAATATDNVYMPAVLYPFECILYPISMRTEPACPHVGRLGRTCLLAGPPA